MRRTKKKLKRIGNRPRKMGFYLTYHTPKGTAFGDAYLGPSEIMDAPGGHFKGLRRAIRAWRKTHKGYRVTDTFFSTGSARRRKRTSRRTKHTSKKRGRTSKRRRTSRRRKLTSRRRTSKAIKMNKRRTSRRRTTSWCWKMSRR